jgi:glycosyltransferase involved in cell wall biosynthesis
VVPRGAPIRLLLVTDTAILGRGGSERFICNLLAGLDPMQFRVDVVQLIEPPRAAERLRECPPGEHIRLEYRPVDAVYGPRGRAVYRELRERVLGGSYDIVQSQHEKSDLLCALLPRTPGGPLRISNRRDMGFQKNALLRTAFRAVNHRFDRVIAPSRAILEQLVRTESVRSERTQCLPNGVDTERFAPLPRALRGPGRGQLGLDPDAFVFGCVARMVPIKRHADLLDGFAAASAGRDDAQLLLVGGGPLEPELRQRAARLGIGARVLFLGERRDIEQLLPLLDCFVLASSTEGMSNAALEAMACGLPVVATAVGGNAEVVEHERTGLLVPPLSPLRLAAAMRELLAHPDRARQMGAQARRRVEAQFSIGAMVRAFARFYQALQPRPALLALARAPRAGAAP